MATIIKRGNSYRAEISNYISLFTELRQNKKLGESISSSFLNISQQVYAVIRPLQW